MKILRITAQAVSYTHLECAHQILFQLDADDRKIACHKRPEGRKKGSRVLRTQEEWNEWQANSLGAAILMPQSEVDRAMWFINSRKPLTCYGWRFYNKDQVKIDTFCGVFGVSRSAAADVYKRQVFSSANRSWMMPSRTCFL